LVRPALTSIGTVLKANMIVDVTPASTGRVALMAFVPRIGVPLVGA
jgi:hypothetical protein